MRALDVISLIFLQTKTVGVVLGATIVMCEPIGPMSPPDYGRAAGTIQRPPLAKTRIHLERNKARTGQGICLTNLQGLPPHYARHLSQDKSTAVKTATLTRHPHAVGILHAGVFWLPQSRRVHSPQ